MTCRYRTVGRSAGYYYRCWPGPDRRARRGRRGVTNKHCQRRAVRYHDQRGFVLEEWEKQGGCGERWETETKAESVWLVIGWAVQAPVASTTLGMVWFSRGTQAIVIALSHDSGCSSPASKARPRLRDCPHDKTPSPAALYAGGREYGPWAGYRLQSDGKAICISTTYIRYNRNTASRTRHAAAAAPERAHTQRARSASNVLSSIAATEISPCGKKPCECDDVHVLEA